MMISTIARSSAVCRVLILIGSMIPRGSSLNPIIISGNKFIDSVQRTEFFIRGIDYYPRPNYGDWNTNSMDFYTSNMTHIWKRDIQYLKQLNVNAIRLYAVNASENHDEFMCALKDAGIYVIVALAHDCPTCAITRDAAPDCYPPELKKQGKDIIDAFSQYDNTLAFSAGNEVNHFAPPGIPQWNAPCQKKFIYDMRKYIHGCHSNNQRIRKVPVGLVSADDQRILLAQYYGSIESNTTSVEESSFEIPEWYGLNSYVYCDYYANTYDNATGFLELVEQFNDAKLPFPIVLTEFGCLSTSFPNVTIRATTNYDDNDNNSDDGTRIHKNDDTKDIVYESQRTFDQARWLLNEPAVRKVFAGGFAFEYSVESENAKSESPYPFVKFGKQNYGIGYFSPSNCDDYDILCHYNPFPEFDNLQKVYHDGANNTEYVETYIDAFVPTYPSLPKQFSRLDSFVWDTDRSTFLRCPKKPWFRSYHEFQCPAGLSTFTEETSSQPSRLSFPVTLLLGLLCGCFVLIVTMITMLSWMRARRRSPFTSRKACWLTYDNNSYIDNGLAILRRIDSDEESEALLSLKATNHKSKDSYSPRQNYHAMSDLR